MMLLYWSPSFDISKHLFGFVIVMLHVLPQKTDCRAEEASFCIGHDSLYTSHAVGFGVIVDSMSSALEPTLDPSVISFREGNDCAEDEWRITLHPQDFLFKKKSDACSTSSVNESNEVG